MSQKVAVLGTGKIGEALLSGMIRGGWAPADLLVTARRDAYVAGFALLNAMGQAEAEDLGLDGGALYDPLGNYRHVAGNWNDWAGDRRHDPVATRTVTPEEAPVPNTTGVTPPPQ